MCKPFRPQGSRTWDLPARPESVVEVDAFPLHNQWPLGHVREDGPNIFAQQANEKKLDGRKKEHSDQQWRRTKGELAPEQRCLNGWLYGRQSAPVLFRPSATSESWSER